MVTTAGERGKSRRGRRRHPAGNTPALVGESLGQAREAAGVTREEVHDRTGILWPQLEGLEAGDLSRFADKKAAITAVRRYADLVRLDAEHCADVVEQHWGSSLAGFREGGAGPGNGHAPVTERPGVVGHLSRFPGDATHLRAFTQTAQVPGVRRAAPTVSLGGGAGAFDATGSFPAVGGGMPPASPRPPLLLRGAIWAALVLLVVAGTGLAVHHWRPQWLKAIHLEHNVQNLPPAGSTGATGSTGTAGSTGGAPAGTAKTKNAVVTLSDSGPGSATVSVRADSYSVVVLAWARCWTRVDTPQSFSPVFNEVLNAGQVRTFPSSEGQLTVSLGASLVTVQVRVGGKAVPGWVFKPNTAPFVLNFASTPST